MRPGIVMPSLLVACGILIPAASTALDELGQDHYTAAETYFQNGTEGHCPIYRLWPGDGTRADDPFKAAEMVKGTRAHKVSAPSMTVIAPKHPDGRAVVLFPGGAYRFLAAGHEGVDVAKWLNQQGITAFLVKYRCPARGGKPKHWAALQDAQRAIRMVRMNAKAFGIRKDRIGVMGFSAGGHLSALTCHRYDHPAYEAIDETDTVSAAPNFAILIYPAYLEEKKQLDPMVKTTQARQIPTYMTIAGDDRGFVKGNILYADYLQSVEAPVSFHLYEKGGHGGGLKGYAWPATAEEWLQTGPVKKR